MTTVILTAWNGSGATVLPQADNAKTFFGDSSDKKRQIC